MTKIFFQPETKSFSLLSRANVWYSKYIFVLPLSGGVSGRINAESHRRSSKAHSRCHSHTFGSNCEVVIYDLTCETEDMILYIENGHVSGAAPMPAPAM